MNETDPQAVDIADPRASLGAPPLDAARRPPGDAPEDRDAGGTTEGEVMGAETTELVKLAAREAFGGPAADAGPAPGPLAAAGGGGHWPDGAQLPEADELAGILQEFEVRVHGCVDALLVERGNVLEHHYESLVEALRREVAEAGARREAEVREELAAEYRARDRRLRANYRRLVDAADRMKQQKAALQEARARFEQKLDAVNALHDKVEEMRRQLRAHLGPEAG